MKKWIARIFLACVAIAFIAIALLYVYRKPLIALYRPVIEQLGDIHIRVVNDTSFVSTKLVVKNRSFLRIEIDTIKYKVSMLDKVYIESEKYLDIKLPKYGTDTIEFDLKIPILNLLKDIRKLRKTDDSASYSINVFLQYSTLLGKSEIPVNRVSKIKIPQPPEIEIVDIKYEKLRRKYILAEAELIILNHNNVALTVKELNYSMKLMGQGNLIGRFPKSVVINPNGKTRVYLPMQINLKNAGKTMWDVLMNNDQYEYTITLDALVQSTDPIEETMVLNLTKTGVMELKK